MFRLGSLTLISWSMYAALHLIPAFNVRHTGILHFYTVLALSYHSFLHYSFPPGLTTTDLYRAWTFFHHFPKPRPLSRSFPCRRYLRSRLGGPYQHHVPHGFDDISNRIYRTSPACDHPTPTPSDSLGLTPGLWRLAPDLQQQPVTGVSKVLRHDYTTWRRLLVGVAS